MARRRGFTLIEMLMVVMIIAVLIMLTPPGGPVGAEAARATQCRNNLLQLGIALGNYASTHRVLPPGVVNDKGPIANLPRGYHVGWAVQILPFLEQANLYRRIDFRQGVYAGANATVLLSSIKTFLCPSDWRPVSMSYMGCHHDAEAPIDGDNHGVLYLNSHVAYDDITDGPAYTILLGEARGSGMLGWASGTRSTLRNGGHPINDHESLVVARPASCRPIRGIRPLRSPAPWNPWCKAACFRCITWAGSRAGIRRGECPALRRLGPVPQADDRSATSCVGWRTAPTGS